MRSTLVAPLSLAVFAALSMLGAAAALAMPPCTPHRPDVV
jgi:hypothetical protein